jgi:hypothetical protein
VLMLITPFMLFLRLNRPGFFFIRFYVFSRYTSSEHAG